MWVWWVFACAGLGVCLLLFVCGLCCLCYNGSMRKQDLFTEKYVKSKLEEYVKSCKFQTFKGALLYIGLYGEALDNIRIGAENGNRAAVRIMDALSRYKFALEVKMEEWLMYQGAHPDLENVKFYNFEHLKFLLRCSNRTYYDNKVIDAARVMGLTNSKDVIKKLPANTTEIKLWNK